MMKPLKHYLQVAPLPLFVLFSRTMNLITISNLTHHYSERILLAEADLLINEGDRIGLIGPNGSGKTTLLRIIAGEETAVSGSLNIWGNVRVHYLPQTPQLDPNLTVLQTIFESDALHIQLLRDYEACSFALEQEPGNIELQQRLIDLSGEMDRTNGWAAEADAKTVLTRLGVTQFDALVGTLSGGQRKRVALAHALIVPTDLLILDEPTNHIDAETISWLEKYILNLKGALLMVTHDRYFLDRVVNRIVELDRRKLVGYEGGYGRYLQQSNERHQKLAVAETKRQAMLRRELAWLQRGAQARTTKQKARKQRVAELQEIHYDKGDQRIAMVLASKRLGKHVLDAKNLSKAYGSLTLFENLDFMLNPGDRIGILGPNGAGKSTFLDILATKTTPDSGTFNWGETVQLGYYDQESRGLKEEMTLLEFMETAVSLINTKDGIRVDVAQMLKWFLFPYPQHRAKISSLSGGERRRLYLLYILARQPNVLFLDEPTNDLDIQTLRVLEQFLDEFKGCLITVSHDRYFLDRNVDFLMSFEDGLLGTRYPTPYESYRQTVQANQQSSKSIAYPKPKPTPKPTGNPPQKLTWKEKKELDAIELQIEQLTVQTNNLEREINQTGSDYQRLQKLTAELTQTQTALETVEYRWLELSEIAENSE